MLESVPRRRLWSLLVAIAVLAILAVIFPYAPSNTRDDAVVLMSDCALLRDLLL